MPNGAASLQRSLQGGRFGARRCKQPVWWCMADAHQNGLCDARQGRCQTLAAAAALLCVACAVLALSQGGDMDRHGPAKPCTWRQRCGARLLHRKQPWCSLAAVQAPNTSKQARHLLRWQAPPQATPRHNAQHRQGRQAGLGRQLALRTESWLQSVRQSLSQRHAPPARARQDACCDCCDQRARAGSSRGAPPTQDGPCNCRAGGRPRVRVYREKEKARAWVPTGRQLGGEGSGQARAYYYHATTQTQQTNYAPHPLAWTPCHQ